MTAICTSGDAYGWTFRPRWWGLAGGGAPGRAERCPALEPTLAQCLGGGAAVCVNGRNGSGVDPPLSFQPRLPHGLHCYLSSLCALSAIGLVCGLKGPNSNLPG